MIIVCKWRQSADLSFSWSWCVSKEGAATSKAYLPVNILSISFDPPADGTGKGWNGSCLSQSKGRKMEKSS